MGDGWSYIWNPVSFVVWSCFVSSEVGGTNLSITDRINQARDGCQMIPRSVKNCVCWRDRGVEIKPRSELKCWLKCHQIATRISAANFLLKARDDCVMYFCTGLWLNQGSRPACSDDIFHRSPLPGGRKRSESEMWWRYNGVLHRSAQNYWPLCRFSLSPPTHPPQHPHSSAVHRASLSGSPILNSPVCFCFFSDSLPLFLLMGSAKRGRQCSRASISVAKCHQLKRDGDILNYWLASKLSPLAIFFLSSISLLIVPSSLFRFSFAFYNIETERNPKLKVIWNSPYKLNCFPPSCWFLSGEDGGSFFRGETYSV